ncbi:MAG: sulfotransferase [Gemmatimonadales bacterium]
MRNPLKRSLHRFVPAHFQDPFGLAKRLLATGDPAARFAMWSAALAALATPIDLALAPFERRRYRSATAPERPITLVCGPPRSGTTLLTQALIGNLPVAFINNLTAIFSRAPLTANRWLSRIPQDRPKSYRSFYGRSTGLAGPNDGLHLWDRWLGSDRTVAPGAIPGEAAEAMRRFFGAFEALYDAPLVAKNNSLNASAALVGEALPTARFICLHRDPVLLAQSLLLARREIHGGDEAPYGLSDGSESADPIESVCRQVRYHHDLARRQLEALGPERFWLVSYEEFCRDPDGVVDRVAREILGLGDRAPWRDPALAPFQVSARRRLPPDDFARLETALGPLRRQPVP